MKHYLTTYVENGIRYAEAWLQINLFGKCFCFWRRRKEIGRREVILVPTHGRLINADALDVIGYCGIPQGYEDNFDSGVMWLAEQIDKLPTVIPAEEGE